MILEELRFVKNEDGSWKLEPEWVPVVDFTAIDQKPLNERYRIKMYAYPLTTIALPHWADYGEDADLTEGIEVNLEGYDHLIWPESEFIEGE